MPAQPNPSSPNTRRLAAILFADIAGYTAVMQVNEADGLRKGDRYRQPGFLTLTTGFCTTLIDKNQPEQ